MATSVWKGHLTFGLVSLPVRLFSAARAESVSFNLLHKSDNSRIKQVTFCQAEDKPIPRSDLVKGYEYEKDRYVVIEDDEIALFNLNGAFYAISDMCPHRGAPLSEGFLEQDKVFCSWHCFDFNLKTGESQVASHLRVATYPVKVEDGGVFILH